MYRVIFFRVQVPRDNDTRIVFNKAYIEIDEEEIFDEFIAEFEARGNKVEIVPIILDGKTYDFTYHETMEEAKNFCERLGYVVNPYSEQEASWNGKLFSVK